MLIGAGLFPAPGCSTKASLDLHQPGAPPAQREMRLESDWAATHVDQGRRACLLDFPLPGGKAGPRDFRCYVETPEGEGVFEIAEHGPARGFLLQEIGLRRGKTVFRSGTVKVSSPVLRPSERVVEVDVACDDGTRVIGGAKIRPDHDVVRRFRDGHAADIASLAGSPEAPAAALAADDGAAAQSLSPERSSHVNPDGAESGNETAPDANAAAKSTNP